MIEFELLETIQASKREAQDAAENVIRTHKAKERRARREASDRRARAAKVAAIGFAIALPAIVALTAPASGVDETADKLRTQRPAVVETQEPSEEAENERIEAALLARAHVIENCKITYYDACVKCCGNAGVITASGVRAVPYVTCAVDPAVIPLGADVLVDYGDGVMHYFKADDTGVTGGHIDVCVTSHSEALWLGVDRATVYWAEG